MEFILIPLPAKFLPGQVTVPPVVIVSLSVKLKLFGRDFCKTVSATKSTFKDDEIAVES